MRLFATGSGSVEKSKSGFPSRAEAKGGNCATAEAAYGSPVSRTGKEIARVQCARNESRSSLNPGHTLTPRRFPSKRPPPRWSAGGRGTGLARLSIEI